uniref:4-chlorobenzoate--CoA ligase n=1 Tax=Pseudomonas sp. (strain CBS-3) TaxID=72586 RepID=CBACL_PSEUC|nr:RecName: Full=4-chlorobenzoate--CoA ligase; Short=4-CBA:CoA ligase [Pseudomonas sp. CBS3]pir/B42560/ 4-chlorobenzoate-CoA ligase (EC 6.2.1.-) - Pseudomonas sp. (strain CBS-3) [Pseudomonas sp.]ABQ44579.1 4-CBA:CoA ligase [Pseudomonas sp. CBS3]
MQTVHEMLRRAVSRVPHRWAIVDAARSTFDICRTGETSRNEGSATARLWPQPARPLAVVSGNSVEAVIAVLALHRLQAVPALMNPRLKPAEISELVARGEMARAVVANDAGVMEAIRTRVPSVCVLALDDLVSGSRVPEVAGKSLPPPPCEPEQAGFVFYTSGTTGLPKGAVIPQRAAESRVLFMATQAGLRHGSHNVVLGLMPLYHTIGFFAVLVAAMAFDGTYVVVEEFDAGNVLKLIERERVTAMFATPTHLDALTTAVEQAGARLESLEHVTFAGATMPDTVLERVNRFIPGEKVNIYGTTEAMNSLYMRAVRIAGTVMRPGFFSEVRIVRVGGDVDDGCPTVKRASWRWRRRMRPFQATLTNLRLLQKSFRKAGTGRAICVRDGSGNIVVLGRVDDMIISGGENIHPSEVERILAAAPGVAEVVVIGVKDERWGQSVVACVVLQPGASASAERLDAFCRASALADFKRPRRYVFLDELPKSAMNKVLRRQLMQHVSATSSAAVVPAPAVKQRTYAPSGRAIAR